MAIFAIGDVHGCAKSLDALLCKIAPSAGDEVVFLGDYVDRGPSSKHVFELIKKLATPDLKVTALKGNHEEMMIRAFFDPDNRYFAHWIINGGQQTMESFNADVLSEMPEEQIEACKSFPTSYRKGAFIFVHAGVNLKSETPMAEDRDLLWIRDWYDEKLMAEKFPGQKIVHGHTAKPRELLDQQLQNNSPFINLDTGCVYKNKIEGMGVLSALEIQTGKLYQQENIDF